MGEKDHRHDTAGAKDGSPYWSPSNGQEVEYQRYYCSKDSYSTPVLTGRTRDRTY